MLQNYLQLIQVGWRMPWHRIVPRAAALLPHGRSMVRPYTQGQPKLLFTFFVLEVVLRQVLTLVVLQSIHLWSGRALPQALLLYTSS